MSKMLKKPYEISLWDDVLITETWYGINTDVNKNNYRQGEYYYNDGANHYVIDFSPNYTEGRNYFTLAKRGGPQILKTYYKEKKLCVIGSDTMTSPIRAVNSKLIKNINGTSTLTFSLYSKYWDEETESFLDNPFLQYMTNERKIKVRYGAIGAEDCEWYDLIIKNISENSDTKTFDYTAKDQFVNELSKSGFDIELDTELENNIGNIKQLANSVLDGSDWRLKEDQVEPLRQYREEPLYKITLGGTDIYAKEMLTEESKRIPAKSIIYAFYSIIENREPNFQFVYYDNYESHSKNGVFIKPNNYLYSETFSYDENGKPSFASSMEISNIYRGERLVRQELIEFDTNIDKYVNVYEYTEISKDESGKEIKTTREAYGFTETECFSPATVKNLVASPNSFTSTSGWSIGKISDPADTNSDVVTYGELKVLGVPDLRILEKNEEQNSYLSCQTGSKYNCLFNSGMDNKRSMLEGFTSGEEYIFRINFGQLSTDSNGYAKQVITNPDKGFDLRIGTYIIDDEKYTIDKILFAQNSIMPYNNKNNGSIIEELDKIEGSFTGYTSLILPCQTTISKAELSQSRIGIFIRFWDYGTPQLIKDVQFFPYKTWETKDANGNTTSSIITPDTIRTDSLVQTKYYYYPKNPGYDYSSIEEIEFLYIGNEPSSNYIKKYNDDEASYEKIRTITASKSNRFNLLQQLAETFECWPRFMINRNTTTGEILLGKDLDGFSGPESERFRQQKWIGFFEENIQENYIGFRYGTNLKSIKRTIESDAIVSKIIVKDNTNEFAKDGFCSIARSEENYCKENFILDFSYYIQQGLLNQEDVNKDLYRSDSGYFGYYKTLRALNNDREKTIEKLSFLITEIANYETGFKTAKEAVQAGNEKIISLKTKIETTTGYTYDYLLEIGKNNEKDANALKWWDEASIVADMEAVAQQQYFVSTQEKLQNNAKASLDNAKNQEIALKAQLEEIVSRKKAINKEFYKKYSRFVQEGSWTSEDYTDDTLYYLDAESTLHTSSQPKISYTIDVIELSQVEDFESYKFALGDKTFIEDTEFFGWDYSGQIKQPYQEAIVVTEIATHFDSPEKNIIKVQNFKTQFEDLFQRITATTQALQFSQGDYQRAANAITEDGKINIDILQNSIADNSLRLENVKDQSVVWDESGITTTSLSNPNEVLRIVSGGLFVSNDSGTTWTTGVTANGINTALLTAGQINTSVINISNGSNTSFRWDSRGISAYSKIGKDDSATGTEEGYDANKFVRFDHYGIYGIDGAYAGNFDPDTPEDGDDANVVGETKIWEKAKYALTWKGFMLKSTDRNGDYISVSSENDFQVIVNTEDSERIDVVKIGCLNPEAEEDYIYGIRIKDKEGAPVLETGSDGKVWIRDVLYIGNNNTTTETSVQIGLLGRDQEVGCNKVIQAGNGNSVFEVFENGLVRASNGEFIGNIIATGGRIKEELYIGPENANNIVLDGINTSIYSDSFSIKPDVATFNNINCAGTIRTVVFEKDSIQALGGMMFFKPSYKIEKFEGCINNNLASNVLITLDKPLKGAEIGDVTEEDQIYKITIEGTEASNLFLVNVKTGNRFKFKNRFEVGIQKKNIQNRPEVFMIKYFTEEYLATKQDENGCVITASLNFFGETKEGDAQYNAENFGENSENKYLQNYDDYYISFGNRIPNQRHKKIDQYYLPERCINSANNPIIITNFYSQSMAEAPKGEYALAVKSDNSFDTSYSQIFWYNYNEQNPLIMLKVSNMDMEELSRSRTALIYFGSKKDAIIGVNSTDGQWANLLYPRGLTIKTFNPELITDTRPEVFLGCLETLPFGEYAGYGLYGENVYLTGSLTTISPGLGGISGSYAGVNTKNGVSATKFQNLPAGIDTSRIVFWAGADANTDSSIQEAPFQVTEQGSIFAKQALLEDAIFTKGAIYGADIYTARIHGYDSETNSTSGLTFYDSSCGISFRQGYQTIDKETFVIGTKGLGIRENQNNSISNIQYLIEIDDNETYLRTTGTKQIAINQNKISSKRISENEEETGITLVLNENNLILSKNSKNHSLVQVDEGWNLYIG